MSSASPQGLARRNGSPARKSMVSRGRGDAPPWLLPHVVIAGLVPGIRATLSTNYYIVMPGFIPGIFLRDTDVDGRNKCHDVIVMTPLAACSDRAYISPDTEPRPTMERISASEARRHLPRLLDRIAQGESLTITRHGKPVARLVPMSHDRDRAQQAAACILERRKHLKRVPLTDLMVAIHARHSQ